jgi:hypothetical protein
MSELAGFNLRDLRFQLDVRRDVNPDAFQGVIQGLNLFQEEQTNASTF